MTRAVAVVTAWHNHTELAPDYFDAVHGADELVIVDNGSDPPLNFADVRLERNTGFCFANNLGLHRALSDVIVFLNNDIRGGHPNWLKELAAHVRTGTLAGARIRYDHHADVDGQPVPYLDGWCLAGLRTDFLELGGWDDTLAEPAYWSDNLLCLEARAAGFHLVEVATGLTHLENATARAMRAETHAASIANRHRYQHRVRELFAVTA